MNQFFTQLKQWPPTTTTVIGFGLVVFAVDYALTGSFVQASLFAGAFKILCPEAGAALDQVADAAQQFSTGQQLKRAVLPFMLAIAALATLTACGQNAPPATNGATLGAASTPQAAASLSSSGSFLAKLKNTPAADVATAQTMATNAAKTDASAAQRSQCLGQIQAPLQILNQQGSQIGVASLGELAIEFDQAAHSGSCETLEGEVQAAKNDVAGVIAGNAPIIAPISLPSIP